MTRHRQRVDAVRQAAEAELAVHREADDGAREAAADRAVRQLDDAEQLYGYRVPDDAAGRAADVG